MLLLFSLQLFVLLITGRSAHDGMETEKSLQAVFFCLHTVMAELTQKNCKKSKKGLTFFSRYSILHRSAKN